MTENLQRLIVIEKEKERLQSELVIAREVQDQLFPKESPKLNTLEVTGVCNAARMVSGDYYDFIRLPDSTLALAIGDVAGKGISAALLMAAIQSIMRAQLTAGVRVLTTATGNGSGAHPFSPAGLVTQLNKQLYEQTAPEKFCTFCFGMYDDDTGEFKYTNGAHLPPVLLRDGRTQRLEVTGTVVGAFPFARYEERTLQLTKGDVLVAFTDGISEPENEYGEMFGEDRLIDLLLKHNGADSREIIARVMEAVHQWTGPSEQQDDMTIVVARAIG